MAMLYRSPSLQSNELLALYGREAEPYRRRDRGHEEYDDVDSEGSEEGRDDMRSSLSLEEGYGVERGERSGLGRVYFSNQDYYQRLEQLKRTHLRNMAEMEKMYICKRSKVNKKDDDEEDECLAREGGDIQDPQPSVTSESQSSGSMPVRRLQRILSNEELNFHEETSSDVSDQSGDVVGGDGEEEDNHFELLLEEREGQREKEP